MDFGRFGRINITTLEKIASEETVSREYLGSAMGANLIHCISIGARNYKGDFLEEVRAYVIDDSLDEYLEELRRVQPGSIKVDFYGGKK